MANWLVAEVHPVFVPLKNVQWFGIDDGVFHVALAYWSKSLRWIRRC